MSEATIENHAPMPCRYGPRFVTNPTTTMGKEELVVVATSGSEGFVESEFFLGCLAVRLPRTTWQKWYWYVLRHHRNELAHLSHLEASEEQLGCPGDATATETPWPEFWTEVGTHEKAICGMRPRTRHLSDAFKPHKASEPDLLAPPARTAIGKRLREIRRRIVASGEPLLDWDAFDREMRERRGERRPEEDL